MNLAKKREGGQKMLATRKNNNFDMFDLFDQSFSSLFSRPMDLNSDMYIEDGKLYLNVNVPGLTKEDITIEIHGNKFLNIKALKQHEKKEDKSEFYIHERNISQMSRRYNLPDGIDASTFAAKVENGLLTISASLLNNTNPSSSQIIPIS